jgi:hypothetical protein
VHRLTANLNFTRVVVWVYFSCHPCCGHPRELKGERRLPGFRKNHRCAKVRNKKAGYAKVRNKMAGYR